jgi:tRNA(fMet)-specific endonuclease VapC
MLDTNICIYAIKHRPSTIVEALRRHAHEGLGISSITAAELSFGVAKSGSIRNRSALQDFLASIEIAPFDEQAAEVYGPIRAKLEAEGTPIGPLDTQIASHAISLDATLVTNNLREFVRVSGLRCVNWV